MTENHKAILAYLAVCLFWGSTYLAIKIGVKAIPPSLFAALRFLIAGSVLYTYVVLKKLKQPSKKKYYYQQSIIGLLMLLGGTGIVCHAEKTLQSGIASLIISTVPLFIALFEVMIFKKKSLSPLGVLGLIMGFGGVAFLALSGQEYMTLDVKGMILTFIASICWSMGSVYSKQISSDGCIISNVAIQMLAGGIGLLILSLLTGEWSQVVFTTSSLSALLYLIVFGSLIAYSCYVYVLDKWPASRVGTYAYVNPVVALILGVLILDEPLTITLIISMVIILSGVILVQRSKLNDH